MPSLPWHLDIESLQALFGSSIYTEGRRPEGGAGEAAAWLPLFALYTGARLEALCQLTCDDVRTSGKITYLRLLDLIDEGADKEVKRLKNEGSRRDIPLAPALVTLGFLDYVAHQRQQGQTWLFPVLVPDSKYGRRGANWSKWWSRWRRTQGVGGREKCFHAFRHAFKPPVAQRASERMFMTPLPVTAAAGSAASTGTSHSWRSTKPYAGYAIRNSRSRGSGSPHNDVT